MGSREEIRSKLGDAVYAALVELGIEADDCDHAIRDIVGKKLRGNGEFYTKAAFSADPPNCVVLAEKLADALDRIGAKYLTEENVRFTHSDTGYVNISVPSLRIQSNPKEDTQLLSTLSDNELMESFERAKLFASELKLKCLGVVESVFIEKFGTPRQPFTEHSKGRIVFDPQITLECIEGLDQFSHLWIVFLFHENGSEHPFKGKVRPPKLGEKVGVFSTRSPHRMNDIGITLVAFDGLGLESICGKMRPVLKIRGIDLVYGTPVLDIKPYHPADRIAVPRFPQWIAQSTANPLKVGFEPDALLQLKEAIQSNALRFYSTEEQAKQAILEIIRADPRTVHSKNKHPKDAFYGVSIDRMDITFNMIDESSATVTKVRVIKEFEKRPKMRTDEWTAEQPQISYPFQLLSVSYLSQEEAREIDDELTGSVGFSIDQLMELAGLSVASAVEHAMPCAQFRSVLVICGPGNNGGDGLVAARHLVQFGYDVKVWYPKSSSKDLFKRLLVQCQSNGVTMWGEEDSYDFIIDAVFGFSFDPSNGIRDPFGRVLGFMRESSKPIVSIDVPSGWHVEKGDIEGVGVHPEVLVSLTAPKLCAQFFKGRHYVGGRFIPPSILSKYQLVLPPYENSLQFTLLQ